MNTLKQKLTSRKFWTMMVGVVVGLAAAFGMGENEWGQVAGVVGSIVSGIVYMLTEGGIDRARAENAMPINIHVEDSADAADVNDLK